MAVQVTEKDAPSWLKWVTDFDNTRKLFLDNWWALKNLRPWVAEKHPELLAKHDAMMKKFMDQVPAIDNLQAIRNQVAQFLSGLNVIGSAVQTGAAAVGDFFKKTFGLGELGLAPIVWVAISVGSASAALVTIANVIKEGFAYSQELTALQTLEAKGYTPEQAASAVKKLQQPKGSLLESITGTPTTLLLFSALAVFLGPPLISALTKGSKS